MSTPVAVPRPASSDRVWSAHQQAFFAACADRTANGGKSKHKVLRARAGTGKTTTIIEALNHFAQGLLIMLCAFNKKIATELTKRIRNPNATASTLHAIGFAAVRARLGRRLPRIGKGKERELGLAEHVCGRNVPSEVVEMVGKLCTKAREITPLAENADALIELAYGFDCIPDDEFVSEGFDDKYVARKAFEALLVAAEEWPCIDFADMIFLPIRNRWLRPTYDVVIVDEAQDMTSSQLMLAKGVCKPDGRILVVGDDRQAIYAFRGADSDALDNLKNELGADELPLTTTYRCGKAIVREAQRLVPDFMAHESNHEGEVKHMGVNDALKEAEPGDFVLSRSNAPLVSVAMRMIRKGRRVRIEGKDIGAGLMALVKKLAGRTNSIPAFLGKLKTWKEKEIARLEKALKEPESAIEKITDKAETLRVLAEGVSGLAEMNARITSLFSDRDDQGNPQSFITCSSVHKSKGLEAHRVVMLSDTFKSPTNSKREVSPKQIREEQNIRYVAITRAKNILIYASGNA